MSATLPKQNGNQTEAARLSAFVEKFHTQHLKPGYDRYVASLTAMRAVDLSQREPHETMCKALCVMVLALERCYKDAKNWHDVLRLELGQSFSDTGLLGVYLADHHVTAVEGQRAVLITDEVALAAAHPDLMSDPKPPTPDKAAIGTRLRARELVVGAALANEPAKPGLRFNSLRKGA